MSISFFKLWLELFWKGAILKDKAIKLSNNVQAIKNLVVSHGYNGNTFTKKIGYSNSIYYQWMSGKKEPELETLYNIADFFNVKFDDYFVRPNIKTIEEKRVKPENRSIEIQEDRIPYNDGELFHMFQQLDERAKDIIRTIIRLEYQKLNKNETDSIIKETDN
ncbi:hypothetical protein SDC9_127854 [bioreactor metagenome]|uniref:HTH cro/C1-type domain-containing protein n=1 Tax=bioreactor metagenome TaxID=1076179 RepID=A0A645CV76_9ZZZZ